jgi:hypothetical protein
MFCAIPLLIQATAPVMTKSCISSGKEERTRDMPAFRAGFGDDRILDFVDEEVCGDERTLYTGIAAAKNTMKIALDLKLSWNASGARQQFWTSSRRRDVKPARN